MALLTLIGTIVMAVFVLTVGAVVLVRRHGERIHGSGSLGNAMQEIEGLFVESKSHVLKVDRAEDAEDEDAPGDPPVK
jgi:hypothetical protein